MNGLKLLRDKKFTSIWKQTVNGANVLDIEEPSIKRLRKVPKRFEFNCTSTSQAHIFNNAEDYYRKIYYEIFDTTVTSLETRFETETIQLLNKFEQFVTGSGNVHVTEVTNFYKDFDGIRLELHRDIFLDKAKRSNQIIRTLNDVVNILKTDKALREVVEEYSRLIRILLTVPGSSCTNERSFSVLRRLKNYLRTTMKQQRLNDLMILHVYKNLVKDLDINKMLNTFITRCEQRGRIFSVIS